eukprot:7758050-Alexandrium_andersonii.AAC.1
MKSCRIWGVVRPPTDFLIVILAANSGHPIAGARSQMCLRTEFTPSTSWVSGSHESPTARSKFQTAESMQPFRAAHVSSRLNRSRNLVEVGSKGGSAVPE